MQYLIFKKHDQNNLQLFSLIINALLLYVQPPPLQKKNKKPKQTKQKNKKNNPLVFALKQQHIGRVSRCIFVTNSYQMLKCLKAVEQPVETAWWSNSLFTVVMPLLQNESVIHLLMIKCYT